MQDFQPLKPVRASDEDGAGVSFFAAQVVSLLADRNAKSSIEPSEALISSLIVASLSGAKSAFGEVLVEARRARISAAILADIYIPIAARRMGEAWHRDEMSWLEVSIGVGRLQSLLREIGSLWVADHAGGPDAGTILLILPEAEQHTLGAMVATGQIRRLGISVCLRISPTSNELRSLLATRQFNGVLISISSRERLEPVAKLILKLRSYMVMPIPIVVGGAVISTMEDPGKATGADFSTGDVGAAMEYIGLKFEVPAVLKQS